MTLSATSIFEIRNGGSDTLNGGLFATVGTGFLADGAATSATSSAPLFSSAAYTFVAGDVGAKVFIRSGTNWIPGWYNIDSVSAGKATLNATAGVPPLFISTSNAPQPPGGATGCATTASPTSATWSIDYSQQDGVAFSLTGLSTAAANAIILTASATKAMVGNGIQITGGTNFTTGVYYITACTAGVSISVDRTCTTAAGSAGTAGLGGGLATLGFTASIAVAGGMTIAQKYNASPSLVTSASTNVAGGSYSQAGVVNVCIFGYDTSRWVGNTNTNRPTLQLSSVSSANIISALGAGTTVHGIIFDGNGNTTSTGILSTSTAVINNCKFLNFDNGGIRASGVGIAVNCEFTGCSTVVAANVQASCFCTYQGNTFSAVTTSFAVGNLIYNNSGATSDGITTLNQSVVTNNTVYNSGRDGIKFGTSNRPVVVANNILEGNGAYGIDISAGELATMYNNATYNNTSGRINSNGPLTDLNPITGSSSFFTNAAGGDFTLNNTASAGALCRAAGFPSAYPGNSAVNYQDVGAYQHQDPAAMIQSRVFTGM